MMITMSVLMGLWALACVLAVMRVIVRERTAAYRDKALANFLDTIPFVNRFKRRAMLRAMRSGNRAERARQGFRSWFGLMHRSRRYTVKLSTPDMDE